MSGDGRYIVSGSDDRTVAVWDLQTGARLHELTGHQGWVRLPWLERRRAVHRLGLQTIGRWRCGTSRPVHGSLPSLSMARSLCLTWHPADRVLVVGDVIGNLYCLEYRQG